MSDRRPARRRMPFELRLALRYLMFHRGRAFLSIITLISVAGVTVGSGALVIALSLMTGFEHDVRERILSGSAHLTVVSALYHDLAEPEATAGRIQDVPGVVAAGPVLYTQAMLTSPLAAAPGFAEVKGVDPATHARVLAGPAAEPLRALGRPTAGRAGIVLGAALAGSLGVVAGDTVRMFVPGVGLTPLGPMPRSHVFEVAGTYSSGHYQEDTQRAYIALPVAQRLLRAESKASWIELRVADLRRLEPIKRAVAERLGAEWSVVDLIEANQDMLRALNTEKLLLFLAIALIVVVAALNIVSTLILMVTDKMKEIGTLSALGARRGSIALVFVLQGWVIGVVGTALGLLLGSGVSYWLDRYEVIRLDPEVYYMAAVPFVTRPFDLATIGFTAILVSLLATIYPAYKAASLDPVEALRHE